MLVIYGAPIIFIGPSLSLSLWVTPFEDYYGRLWVVCMEISLSEPMSYDVTVMQQQRESMWVARFLSDLLSSFDGARSHILPGTPSLGEVFSRLRQATLSSVAPFPIECSALAASIGPSRPSGPYHPPGFGRGQPGHLGCDYPREGRSFGS